MTQNHLIGQVSFDFRASRKTDGVALQSEVSGWFWQEVLPELSRVLDEVVPPDVVLKIDQLVVDMSLVGKVNWKEKLTASLCQTIAEEITRRRLFPRPTDASVQEVSPTTNSFAAWLNFIRTGQQHLSITDPTDWESATLGLIATSATALQTLRRTLRANTTAIERLVRQHDNVFLGQLAEAMTGQPAHELSRWQRAFRGLFGANEWKVLLGLVATNSEELDVIFWMLVVEALCEDKPSGMYTQWISSPSFYYALIKRVTKRNRTPTQLAVSMARFFGGMPRQAGNGQIRQRKANKNKPVDFGEPDLQQAIKEVMQRLPEPDYLIRLFDTILLENRPAIAAFLKQQSLISATESGVRSVPESTDSLEVADEPLSEQPTEPPAEGDVFYIQNAGVVLLHPFLSAFFDEVGLAQNNESAHRRAVQLVHYLATGETSTPEYALLLPKILTGWPIDKPIDHKLKLTKAEKAEAKSLLEMVINYWSVLGSTSADGLREGFFRRDGRLSKRDNGWLLQVETQTLDILLDQLPWGIGVIKHNWMTDFLYVEWC